MKIKPWLLALFLLLNFAVFNVLFGEWCWLSRGEIGFAYNITQAGHVNQKDNPPGHFGFNYSFGWNQRWMKVNGQVLDTEFKAADERSSSGSKYNEEMEWNTHEGVAMSVPYRIFGQVQDPWLFFQHFYLLEHDYDVKMDEHVYEALRQSGKMASRFMCEYGAMKSAEDIRANPEMVRTHIVTTTSEYMHKLGFELTRIDFIGNFIFQDGAAIQEARSQITKVTTEDQSVEQKIANRKIQIGLDQSAASVVANNKIAAANRRASQINAETAGLIARFEPSVRQIGAEATMRIAMAEQYGDLMEQGVLPLAIVGPDSIFASPFYSSAVKHDPVQTAAVPKLAPPLKDSTTSQVLNAVLPLIPVEK